MAASVLLVVGEQPKLMEMLTAKASALRLGQEAGQVGAIIDAASRDRIVGFITAAEKAGAKILVDGRDASGEKTTGNWVSRTRRVLCPAVCATCNWGAHLAATGAARVSRSLTPVTAHPAPQVRPTIILHNGTDEPGFKDEIFGPVLSVLQVATAEEAIKIENANRYGNAASIYTSVGANAEWFASRFRAGMIGVNIGVPVPRCVPPWGAARCYRAGHHSHTRARVRSFRRTLQ